MCEENDTKYYQDRFLEVIDGFSKTFGRVPDDTILFLAPGRTEIGGNQEL